MTKVLLGGVLQSQGCPRQQVAVQVEEMKKGKVEEKNVIELDGTLCGSSLQLFFLEKLRMFRD